MPQLFNPKRIAILGTCAMDCEIIDNTIRVDTAHVNLEFSLNVDKSGYINGDGSPTFDGVRMLTLNFIQGLVANINHARDTGLWEKEKHYNFLLEQLENALSDNEIKLINPEDGKNK